MIVPPSVGAEGFPASSTVHAETVSLPSGSLLASTLSVVAKPMTSPDESAVSSPAAIWTWSRALESGSATCTVTGTDAASSPFTTSGACTSVGASGASVSLRTGVPSKTVDGFPTASVTVLVAFSIPSAIWLASMFTETGDWPPAVVAEAESPVVGLVSVTLTTSVGAEVWGRKTLTGTAFSLPWFTKSGGVTSVGRSGAMASVTAFAVPPAALRRRRLDVRGDRADAVVDGLSVGGRLIDDAACRGRGIERSARGRRTRGGRPAYPATPVDGDAGHVTWTAPPASGVAVTAPGGSGAWAP